MSGTSNAKLFIEIVSPWDIWLKFYFIMYSFLNSRASFSAIRLSSANIVIKTTPFSLDGMDRA